MDLSCPECGSPMTLRPSKFGPGRQYYACTRYPDCRGAHGAHQDGTPLGIPANQATKDMRKAAHATFDTLWKGGYMSRGGAYVWMQKALGMTPDEAHIANFDTKTCARLIRAVWALSD